MAKRLSGWNRSATNNTAGDLARWKWVQGPEVRLLKEVELLGRPTEFEHTRSNSKEPFVEKRR